MTAPLVLVRLIATGACVELPPSTPIVFLRDVREDDRDLVVLGRLPSTVDALVWRCVFANEAAYVPEDEAGFVWHLCEVPDSNAVTLVAPAEQGGSS